MPDPDFSAWSEFQQRLADHGQRRLVVLEGRRDRALAWLSRLLSGIATGSSLWVGPESDLPLSGMHSVSSRKARRWLGRELDCVVWDGWAGNPPDGLAAISGTLNAGGLFFWLMPELADWPRFADPDYAKTGLNDAGVHPFAARMAQILTADPEVVRIRPGEERDFPLPPDLAAADAAFAPGTTSGQQRLVDRLVRLGQGHRRRPLVVTADRGRGKSAALGMAAIQLLRSGRRRVLLTAPSAEAVTSVFRHAWREAFGQDPGGPVTCLEMANGATLEFLEVRDLLARKPAAELVMVDEAAAIPAPLLRQVLLGWPRVAFASTVHGYEGSGRGFDIRFRSVLDSETPQWRSATLEQPVRWASGDPLERLCRRLFLLDASAPEPPEGLADPQTQRWYPSQATEQELSEAFGLLVDAHYRTAPGDLRQWLDDPQSVSWCLRSEGRLAGVLWATREGGLPDALARDVMLGKRRIRGHLLAQSLATHSGFPEAAGQQVLRIVRVAVPAGLREQGLGSRLVQAALDYARTEHLDAVGTSFGGSPALARFWKNAGMQFVRAGLQREASSGEYPVQFLAGFSQAGRELQNRLVNRLGEHWLTLVPLSWTDMEPELLLELTMELPAPAPLTDEDIRDLHGFACGYRGYLLCLPVLRKFSLQPGVPGRIRASGPLELWCGSVLQGRTWADLQEAGLCTGRREGENRLRAFVAGFPEIAVGL